MDTNYILYKERLTGEYLETFNKIDLYATVIDIDVDTKIEMLSDLLDTFYSAQEENKPIKKIIGSNVENFCKLYFENYSLGQRILGAASRLYSLCWFIFIVELTSVLFEKPQNFNDFLLIKTNMAGYIVGFLCGSIISVLVSLIFQKYMFIKKHFSFKTYCISAIIFLISCIPFFMASIGYDIGILMWPVILATVLYIVIFKITSSLINSNRRESKKESKFKNIVINNMPANLINRYHTLNKKLEKRGKELLTPETYMVRLEKEVKIETICSKIIWIFLMLFFLVIIILVALTSAVLDTLVFVVILCIVELPIIAFLRINDSISKAKATLVKEWSDNGIPTLS